VLGGFLLILTSMGGVGAIACLQDVDLDAFAPTVYGGPVHFNRLPVDVVGREARDKDEIGAEVHKGMGLGMVSRDEPLGKTGIVHSLGHGPFRAGIHNTIATPKEARPGDRLLEDADCIIVALDGHSLARGFLAPSQ
jgi:hypothetical protein